MRVHLIRKFPGHGWFWLRTFLTIFLSALVGTSHLTANEIPLLQDVQENTFHLHRHCKSVRVMRTEEDWPEYRYRHEFFERGRIRDEATMREIAKKAGANVIQHLGTWRHAIMTTRTGVPGGGLRMRTDRKVQTDLRLWKCAPDKMAPLKHH